MQLVLSDVFIMMQMHTFTFTFILELLEYRHFILFIYLVVVAKSFILYLVIKVVNWLVLLLLNLFLLYSGSATGRSIRFAFLKCENAKRS